jgi:hypothetical protein
LREIHPKSHGCVAASFIVPNYIGRDYKVGLFAKPGTYKAMIRYSNASVLELADLRGGNSSQDMAIKVSGVNGSIMLADPAGRSCGRDGRSVPCRCRSSSSYRSSCPRPGKGAAFGRGACQDVVLVDDKLTAGDTPAIFRAADRQINLACGRMQLLNIGPPARRPSSSTDPCRCYRAP